MSDTPQTDALADLLITKCSHSESCYYEMRMLCRQLERERDEAIRLLKETTKNPNIP